MDLCNQFIRLPCDNRASAQPLPRFGIFPSFPKAGKGEGPSVFHSDRERQLRSGGFSPFVESVRRNQAASFYECFPERRRFIDGLGSGVDGPVSDLRLGSLAQYGINPHCKASSERARVFGLKRMVRTF
jgi:hypothetical protein